MVTLARGRAVARAAVAACTMLVLTLAGCASEEIRPIKDETDFQAQVLASDKPIMVDFYKGGCPTCALLDPMMNKLAEEYRGRVVFARFELMKPYFAVTSEKLKTDYDIAMFPTEILFVNGKEKARWVIDYNEDGYRKVLNEVAGPAPAVTSAGGGARSAG